MTVLNNGRVGIGTVAPAEALHVSSASLNSSIYITGTTEGLTSSASIRFGNNLGDDRGLILYTSSIYSGLSGANAMIIYQRSNAPISLYTSNTERIRIVGTGEVGVNTGTPSAQHHIVSGAAARIAQIIQLAATPTANAQEIRNSAGTVLSATRPDGSWQPPQIADAAAANNSLYYSTTLSKLVFKDPTGTVNPLY